MQNRILWKQSQQGSMVCVIVASDDRAEETVARMSPVSAICLLPQFIGCSSAGSSPPGHLLVSSQLRWHCSVVTGHHHCARTARVPARRMGTAPEYELSPPTTTSRQTSCSHSLCVGMTRLTLTHGPISYLPREPSYTPGTRAGAAYGHYITSSAHLHSGPTLHIQSTCKDYNAEFIRYINRIFVFATNIWWYCCWPMNVVTKLRNAKYVFVHLHSVFDCPSPSQNATHFLCWWWRK